MHCSRTLHPELFSALPHSYGTLGYVRLPSRVVWGSNQLYESKSYCHRLHWKLTTADWQVIPSLMSCCINRHTTGTKQTYYSRSWGTFFLSSLLLVKDLATEGLKCFASSSSSRTRRPGEDPRVCQCRKSRGCNVCGHGGSWSGFRTLPFALLSLFFCTLLYMFVHFYLLNLGTFLNMWRHCPYESRSTYHEASTLLPSDIRVW